ncbi:MAG: response regulator transcription factor [Acetatifactor sp.]|nr:response regulator transcription factor [Acetatifactor sp.]
MQRIAVYQNKTGVAEKLELLCRGEQISIVKERSEKALLEDIRNREVQMVLLDGAGDLKGWSEGLVMIANLRKQSRIPIMVIARQINETIKVAALSIGADDYVPADDNPLVILARIKSQLRRYTQLTAICKNLSKIYKVDGLEIDDEQRKVTVDGREVRLTPTEYEILKLLVMEKGKVLSIHQIYEDIWKMQAVDVDNTVAVHVRHIREKIELNPRKPRYLKVIWGTGYMVG